MPHYAAADVTVAASLYFPHLQFPADSISFFPKFQRTSAQQLKHLGEHSVEIFLCVFFSSAAQAERQCDQ